MKKTAVVLLNLGGPTSPDEIEPFLFRLFSDPAILRVPNPLSYILARTITKKRLPEATHIYSLLGGASPLLQNTKAQAKALEEHLGPSYKSFIAMRYATPLTAGTVEEVRAYAPDQVILLPLYPQYSTTTTESSVKLWKKLTRHDAFETRVVESYPTAPGFMEAKVDLFHPLYQAAQRQGRPQVLLTAHGLPERTIKRGDPYQSQVEASRDAFLKHSGLNPEDVTLCYQSRVGPLKWIGPSTDDEIIRAARARKPIVVVPLSFVSEHSETLVELDITYKDLALREGAPGYYRVPTVGTHPAFIRTLSELVGKAVS